MERRKVLKIAAGSTAAIAATSYFVLDNIFNPKTPLNYAFQSKAYGSEALTPTPECAGHSELTIPQTEGPFYTPNTPNRTNLIEAGTAGIPMVLEGYVVDTQCRPVAGAVLDFWSCDGNGVYDNEGMKLRGHQFADAQGYYRLETVRPSHYRAGPFGSRTAHIHVKVQGKNKRLLTTQLYFPGEPLNAEDGIFDQALLLNMLDEKSAHQKAGFNFVLA